MKHMSVYWGSKMIVHKKEKISISKSECHSFFLALDVYKAIQKFFFIFNKDKDAGVFFYLLPVDKYWYYHAWSKI